MSKVEQSLEPEKPKKPYAPPRLTRLGSVRDLTFGPSGTVSDAVGGGKTKKTR